VADTPVMSSAVLLSRGTGGSRDLPYMTYIQGVPIGMCQISGGCSLC
jgi:hypothetical protein